MPASTASSTSTSILEKTLEKAPVSQRAVVIGGSGQIGGWLLRTLAERGHTAVGTFATVSYPGLVRLDAADLNASAAWVKAESPDVVFYPAGFTWVDGCERDPARAYGANLDQPLNLARAAAEVGARFVYFSTDYVFDGKNGPYSEDSPTNPLSVYGKAKRDAELALARELGDGQLIVRTSWVFGPERQGKNFAYQLVRSLIAGKAVVCPSDQISSPSYGPDVARTVVLLAEEGMTGLVHVACPEVVDRVRFARAIAVAFGFDPGLISGKPTSELGQGAPRPLNGGLLTVRLDAWKNGLTRSLDSALLDFRKTLLHPDLRNWIQPLAGIPPIGTETK
jgi:dTDP-4-dehydrorhamnose reductase